MAKRRVYVMDCGNVVKIGVSGNVELRKSQLPLKVYQYYSTAPIEKAFEIEKTLHKKFSAFKAGNAGGNEYFNITFERASDALRELTDARFAEIVSKRRAENELELKKYLLDYINERASQLSVNDLFFMFGCCLGETIARQDSGKKLQEA